MSAACPEKAVDDVVRSALDCCELWAPSHVERFSVEELSPFKFCRDFVAASRPVVFTGRLDATSTDRNEDWLGLFKEAVGESLLTAMTGDADGVCYYSLQNDSLNRECATFASLVAARSELPLPEAFLECFADRGGAVPQPQAVNVWLGGSNSMTWAHRDGGFENLYLVLTGRKTFRLLPPAALAALTVQSAITATWVRRCPLDTEEAEALLGARDQWALIDDAPENEVIWLATPDLCAAAAACGLPRPAEVVLEAGDLLYLPAGWVHQVFQDDETLAVNWWYDARYDDARWAAHELARAVGEQRCGLP
ncbi:cupin-like domain-containing protein [Pelagophyceae sp. CCMP2097]|nr:cupin-like domain-containing protein [Pelagophyceae sp. CCMP2097]